MVIEPHKFKILPFLLHGCPTPQLQNVAIPTMAFSLHNFKTLPTLLHFFFFFWFHVSIIIAIVSNITVLVSYNVIIWFGYFMSMRNGFNKDSSQVPPTITLPHFFLFCKKCLISIVLLWSNYSRKIMHFQSKTIFFFPLIAGWVWFCYFIYIKDVI